MSKCPNCDNEISVAKAFCSKECKEIYFKKVNVQIPTPLIKMVAQFNDKEKADEELKAFALRHNFDFELVKIKAYTLIEEFIAIEKLKKERLNN